jgi:hypothetical protein
VTPRGTSRASSTFTFGDIACDPGMFNGDSKACPFPSLTDRYRSWLSTAFSGANVCFWHLADIAKPPKNVRFLAIRRAFFS